MIKIVLNELLQFKLLISIVVSFSLYAVIIFMWSKLQRSYLFFKQYSGIQRAHEGEISRIGGLVIFINLSIFWLLNSNQESLIFIQFFLVSSLPLLLISLKEDVFHNTYPITRLMAMCVSIILFFIIYDIEFPKIEVPFLGEWLTHFPLLAKIFFLLCVLVIINGSNLIDGTNGLLPVTILMQLLSLMYLSYLTNDIELMTCLSSLLIPLLIFLIFNYPWGKIFLGDAGAYLLGFMTSLLTIILFSKHPELPTWLGVAILFYPGFELLFSMLRRSFQHKKQMSPDQEHLHNMIFNLLKKNNINTRYANSLVMPSLIIFWGLPFILILTIRDNIFLIGFFILTMIIIYLGFYWIIYCKNRNNEYRN